jgi:hypothetical protein
LKGEISAKISQNHTLQHKITELEYRYKQFDIKGKVYQTSLQQKYSYIVDDNIRSPAIECTAFKLEAAPEASVALIYEDQFLMNKIQIRESSESQNVLKT